MNIFLKAFLFLLAFGVFHFGYELTGLAILKPFCGINESVFQHLKMAFWGYILLSIIERFILKKSTRQKIKNFWYSRILSAIIIPYIIALIWYLAPAFWGRIKSPVIDLIWALFATYLSGLFVAQIEKETEIRQFKGKTKSILISLFVVSGVIFVYFTYKLPWIDIFVNPLALPR